MGGDRPPKWTGGGAKRVKVVLDFDSHQDYGMLNGRLLNVSCGRFMESVATLGVGKKGEQPAVNLCVYTRGHRITINEGRVREKTEGE